MTVEFDLGTTEKKSRHDLDQFLDLVPRVMDERTEVLAEQNLKKFRTGLSSDINVIFNHSLNESAHTLWLEGKYAKPAHGFRGFDNFTGDLWRALRAEHYFDQYELADKPVVDGGKFEERDSSRPVIVETRVVSIGKMHAMFWLLLVLGGILWGIAAGASIFAGIGLSPTVVIFGVLGTMALSATAFALSLQTTVRRHEG